MVPHSFFLTNPLYGDRMALKQQHFIRGEKYG